MLQGTLHACLSPLDILGGRTMGQHGIEARHATWHRGGKIDPAAGVPAATPPKKIEKLETRNYGENIIYNLYISIPSWKYVSIF